MYVLYFIHQGYLMTRVKKSARVGAAAFALGLSLAGPQAVGVALADSGDGSGSVSSPSRHSGEAAPQGGGRQAHAGAAAARAVTPGPASAVTTTPRDAGADTAHASGPTRVTGVRGPRAGAAGQDEPPIDAAPTNTSPTDTAAQAPTPATPTRGLTPPDSGVLRPAASLLPVATRRPLTVPRTDTSALAPAPATPAVLAAPPGAGGTPPAASPAAAAPRPAQAQIPTAAAALANPRAVVANPVNSTRAAVNNAVNTVFDTLTKWLSVLPPNQITDAVTGSLWLLRRSLFDQMPTTSPSPFIIGDQGKFRGFVSAVDPIGEIPTFTLTGGPAHGSVQLNTDGTYTYTPTDGYTGPDQIIVEVSDPGFDLLNPFSKRVKSVTVTLPGTANTLSIPSIRNSTGAPVFGGSLFDTGDRSENLDVAIDAREVFYLTAASSVPAGQFYRYVASLSSLNANAGLPVSWIIQIGRPWGSETVKTSCTSSGPSICTFASDPDPLATILRWST
jgi:hypothetical protein